MKRINKILLGVVTLVMIGTTLPTQAYAEVEVGLATGQYNQNTGTSNNEHITKTTNNFTAFETDYVVKALGTDNTITGVNVTFIPVDYYGKYLETSVEIHDVPIVGNNTIKLEQLSMLGIGVNWKPGAIAGYQGDIVVTDSNISPGRHIEVKMRYYERIEVPSKLYSQAEGKSKSWEKIDEKWYYIDESRNIFSGWKEIDGNWYAFDPYMYTGFKIIFSEKYSRNTWYYFGDNGVMRTGWQNITKQKSVWATIDGKDGASHWYYFGDDGAMRTGWQNIDGNWYYFNPYKGLDAYSNISPIYDGQMVTDTTIDGYYLNADGVCVS